MPTCTTSKSVPMRQTREGSRYRPATDKDDVRQQPKQANKDRDQIRDILLSIEQLTRKADSMRRRILGGSGSAAAGMNFRGEFDPTSSYAVNDVVVIRAGSNAGSYVAIQSSGSQAPVLPDTGNLFWLSLSGNAPALGAWLT